MRLLLAGVLLLTAWSGGRLEAQTTAAPQGAAKAPEPWPDAAALRERRLTAEGRPLFSSTEPVTFRLIADFRAVQGDRNPQSTRTYPATLVVSRSDGSDASIPMRIRTRGHSRRRPTSCTFAPLRLEFDGDTTGTIFEGQRALKLGVHCRDAVDYEQYVLREYAVYRLFNVLTPRSFRARLAQATYVNAGNKRVIGTRNALFLEDDDDVARRLEGRVADVMKMMFPHVHGETITLLTLFAYMIGNTDMSMYGLHNIRLVRTSDNVLYPVPYDFDYSGLVNTRYSRPDPQLPIKTVRQRLYRGPCHSAETLQPFFARLRAARTELMAVYDAVPGLEAGYRRDAREYLDEFFRAIDRPGDVRRAFIDNCTRGGM